MIPNMFEIGPFTFKYVVSEEEGSRDIFVLRGEEAVSVIGDSSLEEWSEFYEASLYDS